MKIQAGVLSLLLLIAESLVAQGNASNSLQRIKCSADSTQEYALYLPPGYSAERKYPVIIFLDPGARGNFPVEKYHSVGGKYGIIMAGSFNSRNFDGASSTGAFIAIYNDLVKNRSVDPAKVWLSGFSGGSRVAAALAMEYPEIAGVIACGAGFAEMEDDALKKIKTYAAISGNRDMNFGELLDNNVYLDGLGVNNILLEFEGGHEWPPVIYMDLAILWMTGRGDSINDLADPVLQQVNTQSDSGMLYAAWSKAKQLQKIPGLKEKAGLVASTIEKQKNFINDQQLYEQVMEEERKYMNEFSLAFGQLLSQPPGETIEKQTWIQKAERIGRLTKDKIRYKQLSGQRCFDHSTRSCMEYYFQLVSISNYAKALDVAGVLVCFDPAGSNGYYMLARAEAGMGNKKRCEKQLKEAIKKGLTWSRRIGEDKLLLTIFSEQEINKIFERE